MIDTKKLMLSSDMSSLKLFQSGSGTISYGNLPSGSDLVTTTIPHNIGNDNIITQVGIYVVDAYYILPFLSNDSRFNVYTATDSNNLYIYTSRYAPYSAFPSGSIAYTYRIIVP